MMSDAFLTRGRLARADVILEGIIKYLYFVFITIIASRSPSQLPSRKNCDWWGLVSIWDPHCTSSIGPSLAILIFEPNATLNSKLKHCLPIWYLY